MSVPGKARVGFGEMQLLHDALFEAFNKRAWKRFYSLFTADFVVATDPAWPGGGEYRGREEFERFISQFLEPWEELRYEPAGEPFAVNGRLIQRGTWVARGRTTGIPGTLEFSVVTTVRDGLIARGDFFLSERDAVEFAQRAPT